MRIGELLVEKKLATGKEIASALETRKRSRIPVGKIAVSLDMVFSEDADKIHSFQSDSGELFGDSGIRMGYLTKKQVETLLAVQKRLCLPVEKIISMEKGYWKEPGLLNFK